MYAKVRSYLPEYNLGVPSSRLGSVLRYFGVLRELPKQTIMPRTSPHVQLALHPYIEESLYPPGYYRFNRIWYERLKRIFRAIDLPPYDPKLSYRDLEPKVGRSMYLSLYYHFSLKLIEKPYSEIGPYFRWVVKKLKESVGDDIHLRDLLAKAARSPEGFFEDLIQVATVMHGLGSTLYRLLIYLERASQEGKEAWLNLTESRILLLIHKNIDDRRYWIEPVGNAGQEHINFRDREFIGSKERGDLLVRVANQTRNLKIRNFLQELFKKGDPSLVSRGRW